MTGLDVEALLEETAAEFGHPPLNGGTASRQNDRPPSSSNQTGKRDRDLLDDRRRHRDDGQRSDSGSIRSSRRRSRSRDDDRRRNRDDDDRYYRPGSGSGRGRGGRSRSPNGDRYYRPHGRDRHDDRHRERDNPRDRSRDRNRDRHRDSERRRDYDDRDRRDGRNGDARGHGHHRQRSKSKSPQLNEDERDRRTVFVQQLAARLRTKELRDFFAQVGPVRDGQIVKDRVSGRSKGVGYVEFMDEESVPKAIDLTGQKLLGIPIIVQLTEAEKNRQARNAESTQQAPGVPFHRLYVGNIHFSITEDDLKTVFEPFGELEFVQLQKEDQGRSRGYGFVQFIDPAAAKEALDKMNGFDLAGRPIRVGLGNDKFTNETTQSLLKTFPNGQQNQSQGSAFSGAGGRGHYAGGSSNFDRAGGRDEKAASGASALDDSDVNGVNFKNVSRDALMRKLMRAEDGVAATTQQTTGPAKPIVVAPQASRCVKLSNVFSAAEETGDNWVKELEDEVRKECNDSYGKVVHIAVDAENDGGDIYVKFENTEGGLRALQGLNGRWFGGRTVTCAPVVDAVYSTIFGRAAGP